MNLVNFPLNLLDVEYYVWCEMINKYVKIGRYDHVKNKAGVSTKTKIT